MRLGIVIDTKRCMGCNSCTVICKQKNGTPPGVFFTKVFTQEVGTYPSAKIKYQPMLCMHCDEPPCVDACPTGASYKREDGIVLVDQDKCIGCRSCIIACPYCARYFDFGKANGYYPEKGLTEFEKSHQEGGVRGTVSKCTLCADMVDAGEAPACVQVCPTQARIFGDLDDPNSEISRLIAARGGYQLHPDLGTNPSVFYLPG
jgi:Fe-S-cluster-containing dehydrogenase component